MSHVLVVDDEETICWGLERLLTGDGHSVSAVPSAEAALALAERERPDVVVLDVRLPGIDGISAMRRFAAQFGEIPIVVMTAFGNLDTAVNALQQGAFEYLAKPFDLDQVSTVVRRALERAAPRTASLSEPPELSDELVGRGPAMQEVFKRIAIVAPTDAAVLITGESGVGKELVARAIHRHSPRASHPLLPVNVAALSPALVESELFGHVRGAFTGADVARKGLLELAHGGAVLFDEVADIAPAVQVKLLRVIEQRELTPVGGSNVRPAAFRVLAATHRDLRDECAQGRFREDLYFRLAVFEIRIPPLRERPEDIPLLVERFLQRWTRPDGMPPEVLAETIDALRRRPWRGNVRELRNAIEHGALVARGNPIAPEHLPPAATFAENAQDSATRLARAVRDWAEDQLADAQSRELHQRLLSIAEPPLFETVLRREHGNKAAAADILGLHRATLRKKLLGDATETDD